MAKPLKIRLAHRALTHVRCGTLDRALTELSSIARNLRPPALDQLGLQQALLSLAEDYALQSKSKVYPDIQSLGDKLTEAGKSALSRVAQQALTNVTKHATATASATASMPSYICSWKGRLIPRFGTLTVRAASPLQIARI